MRKRIVRKIGNSYYVKLEPADVKDWELKKGDLVKVEPLKNNNNKK